jgi:hypothetical protein
VNKERIGSQKTAERVASKNDRQIRWHAARARREAVQERQAARARNKDRVGQRRSAITKEAGMPEGTTSA